MEASTLAVATVKLYLTTRLTYLMLLEIWMEAERGVGGQESTQKNDGRGREKWRETRMLGSDQGRCEKILCLLRMKQSHDSKNVFILRIQIPDCVQIDQDGVYRRPSKNGSVLYRRPHSLRFS